MAFGPLDYLMSRLNGRIFNARGEPVDNFGPYSYNIHRSVLAFIHLDTMPSIFKITIN